MTESGKITPERLQSCYDEIDRLTRLIGNIEVINKIEAKYDYLNKTEFNIYKLIESVIENFASKIESKTFMLKSKGITSIYLQIKIKMNQVVINLLNNAIKFTQKEGTIKFSISKNKDHVLLIVEDNWHRLEKKDQQLHIFDRFYMADPSRSRALGGARYRISYCKERY